MAEVLMLGFFLVLLVVAGVIHMLDKLIRWGRKEYMSPESYARWEKEDAEHQRKIPDRISNSRCDYCYCLPCRCCPNCGKVRGRPVVGCRCFDNY